MIKRKTVLILGAGASMPYKFPSGKALLNEVLFYLNKENNPNWLNILKDLGIEDEDYICDFYKKLFYSGRKSVDEFLEHQKEFLKIGKLAIALALIPYEKEDVLFDIQIRENSWYEYLFDKLNAPLDLFEQNRLSIITFNYDRSIEHYLYTAIKHAYPISRENRVNMVNSIPIIHVHGKLGTLPWQKGPGRPYNHKTTPGQMKLASRQIVIMSENIDTSPEFDKAFQLMENAEKICFLGFGYNDVNLRRLKIDKIRGKIVMGTSYRLGNAEVGSITGKWGNISFSSNAFKILDFFKEIFPLE